MSVSLLYDSISGVCYRGLAFLRCSRYRVGTDGTVWSRAIKNRWRKLKNIVVNGRYEHVTLIDDDGNMK